MQSALYANFAPAEYAPDSRHPAKTPYQYWTGRSLGDLFDTVVGGLVSERLHLRGKPEPDIFLQCLAWLNSSAEPRDAAIVEDAISGIEAGRRGGFGLVLGADRHSTGDLKANGADWVIRSFSQITATEFMFYFALLKRAA